MQHQKTMPFASPNKTASFLRPYFRPDTSLLSQSPRWRFASCRELSSHVIKLLFGSLGSRNFPESFPEHNRRRENRKAKVHSGTVAVRNYCVLYTLLVLKCIVICVTSFQSFSMFTLKHLSVWEGRVGGDRRVSNTSRQLIVYRLVSVGVRKVVHMGGGDALLIWEIPKK